MIRKYKVRISMRCYWDYDDIEFDDKDYADLEHYLRSDEFEMTEDPEEYDNFKINYAKEIK